MDGLCTDYIQLFEIYIGHLQYISCLPFKVTMDNLKCNYLATSPPFILQAVRSRRMKQVILEVDKIQLVVRGVQQPNHRLHRYKEVKVQVLY